MDDMTNFPFDIVGFDLDGTLADTAPDLGRALNRLLSEQGRAEVPHAVLRPHVSAGTRGMLRVGFGIAPDDAAYPALHKRFLDIYELTLCEATTLFDGIDDPYLRDRRGKAAKILGISRTSLYRKMSELRIRKK